MKKWSPRYRPPFTFSELGSCALSCKATSDELEKLENSFAKTYGYETAVWFPYARHGIQCFLESIPNDKTANEVVVSPFNCIALAQAVARSGSAPLYVDTETNGFNEDPNQTIAASRLTSVKAVISVSLWGTPGISRDYSQVAKPILYDYALRALDESIPELRKEDAVVYSMGWGKPLASLNGAFLCSQEKEKSKVWRNWRNSKLGKYSRLRETLSLMTLMSAFSPRVFGLTQWVSEKLPIKSKLRGNHSQGSNTEWNFPSRFLLQQTEQNLNRLAFLRRKRRVQVNLYWNLLKSHVSPISHVPWLSHYPILTENKIPLREWAISHKIFVSHQLFDKLLCEYPEFRGRLYGGVENARLLCRTLIHLPLHFRLSEREQKEIANLLLSWEGNQNVPTFRKTISR